MMLQSRIWRYALLLRQSVQYEVQEAPTPKVAILSTLPASSPLGKSVIQNLKSESGLIFASFTFTGSSGGVRCGHVLNSSNLCESRD